MYNVWHIYVRRQNAHLQGCFDTYCPPCASDYYFNETLPLCSGIFNMLLTNFAKLIMKHLEGN